MARARISEFESSRVLVGKAAENGILSAYMAKEGITGGFDIFLACLYARSESRCPLTGDLRVEGAVSWGDPAPIQAKARCGSLWN
jgi:hypothetical protein